MSVTDTIRRKLTERFAPTRLEVEDQSHHHIGHEGARPGGETHFAVTIASAAFIGQSRVARQRLVYQTLADYAEIASASSRAAVARAPGTSRLCTAR